MTTNIFPDSSKCQGFALMNRQQMELAKDKIIIDFTCNCISDKGYRYLPGAPSPLFTDIFKDVVWNNHLIRIELYVCTGYWGALSALDFPHDL